MQKYKKKIASPVDLKNLPRDILPNIFIRLLAKQLIQMRCVCKSWNTLVSELLSEPSFIKSHLHLSIHNNDGILLFFHKNIIYDSHSGQSTARPSRSPHLELTNFTKLKLPVNPRLKKAFGHIIGSVNGLICFIYQSNCDSNNNINSFIRIWNPSLSASLTLPPTSLPYEGYITGFGFDPKTDDYKVVRLGSFDKKPIGEVYSMRNGSWELISHSVPSHIKYIFDHDDVCVDGLIHWLSATKFVTKRGSKRDTIVTLDLGTKTFGEIPLPDSIIDCPGWCTNKLGVLGGKLCLMSRVQDGKCEVWVMGEDKLWVKDQVFSQFSCHITPYGFTSQNEFLFRDDNNYHFTLYDPVAAKTKIKNFKIKMERQCYGNDRYKIIDGIKIIAYVDSLVWIAPASQFKLVA